MGVLKLSSVVAKTRRPSRHRGFLHSNYIESSELSFLAISEHVKTSFVS